MKPFALFAALSFLSLTTHAQDVTGVNLKVVSLSTSGNYCMDADHNKKADGTRVFMYVCHGKENQRWTVTTSAEAGSALIGTGGYCLDVRGGASASAGTGTPVQLWKCNFNTNQRFLVGRDGTIKEQASGKCLQASADKDAAPIVLQACTGAPTEKWRFEP